MTISNAVIVYYTKFGEKSFIVSHERSQQVSPNVVILKDSNSRRIACVVESKAGFVVDAVKKLHPETTKTRLTPQRDSSGRFVKTA
jgi:hypothetical protein